MAEKRRRLGKNEARLEHSKVILCQVHPKEACAGQRCTIHNRTDHCMREFPQLWRSDRRIMERVCPHGIGHPDPDTNWHMINDNGTHGCDGCCRPGLYEKLNGIKEHRY